MGEVQLLLPGEEEEEGGLSLALVGEVEGELTVRVEVEEAGQSSDPLAG